MELKEKIDRDKLPRHVAVIMDGNGRWARKKGNQRIFGHQNGVKAVRETVEAAAELGIKFLTLYAFSTENWKRPQNEVNALMHLLISTLNTEIKTLQENNVKLLAIGDLDSLPVNVHNQLKSTIELTAKNTGLSLVLALSYSGRWEMLHAMKNLIQLANEGKIFPDDLDEQTFYQFMQSSFMPYPELLIRTSGEYRISNFLLWQIAYTELYFTPILWPDFRKENFYEAILDFQKRERRFGKTSDQLINETAINVNNNT
ncbi:MAG: isoprenyl transferase [Bacteroidales bacterium]